MGMEEIIDDQNHGRRGTLGYSRSTKIMSEPTATEYQKLANEYLEALTWYVRHSQKVEDTLDRIICGDDSVLEALKREPRPREKYPKVPLECFYDSVPKVKSTVDTNNEEMGQIMSETNETKLREALKAVVAAIDAPVPFSFLDNGALLLARKVLAETEPKHAAVVAWEAWSGCPEPRTNDHEKRAFLAGYKAGMSAAANISCHCEICETPKRIRDAAEKVPKE